MGVWGTQVGGRAGRRDGAQGGMCVFAFGLVPCSYMGVQFISAYLCIVSYLVF